MKSIRIIGFLLTLSLSSGILTACQEKPFLFVKGEKVKFSVGSVGNRTKAAYADENTIPGEGDTKVRIDWEPGDLIRIYCAQASEPETHFADYIVNAVEEGSGAVSKAKIQQWGLEDKGLRWGEISDKHEFYAVYPSPINVDRQVVRTEDVFPGPSGKETTMTGVIEEVQRPASLVAGESVTYLAKADLTNEYMVAKKTVIAGEQTVDDGVFLQFKPIVTAIQFTIANDFINDIKNDNVLHIRSIELTSKDHFISGKFSAFLDGLDEEGNLYPQCESVDGGHTVSMDFTGLEGGKISLEKGETLRFTLFLKPEHDEDGPVDIDDLTFKVYRSDKSWVSTRLGYIDGTGVVFPCHKISYATGILVPEGAVWTIGGKVTVTPWDTVKDADGNDSFNASFEEKK